MSWDLFVMDLPRDLKSADALPSNWAPGPLPPRDEIIRTILAIDPTADASDPIWVRVKGTDFSVEIHIPDQVPLTQLTCHVRGTELAIGFIATLLERLQLRALDPGSESGVFDPAVAAVSQTRWHGYRDRVVSEHPTVAVVARLTESIQPVARGAKYEDRLSAVLTEQGCGRVTGAGSQLNERFEIAFVDIEMILANLEGALALARTTLLTLGAPIGSTLHFMRDGKPRAVPIHGGGPEADSPETIAALTRRLIPTAQAGSPSNDPAVIKAKAAKFLTAFEGLFVAHPETVPVDSGAIDPAVLAWYDDVTRALAAEGFRRLGDFTSASVTARKDSLASIFSRKFLSVDGLIRVTAILIAATKPGQVARSIIGLNSDLEDGTCLRTVAASIEKWDRPDQLLVEHLPQGTPIRVITARHRARLQALLAPYGTHSVITMQSLEEVFASEARVQSLTSAFRRRRGIPSIDEIQRFGVARPIAELMHGEMQAVQSRRSKAE